ncbi:MAG TPA: Ohr family peroxiredoxin [Chitinophagaceae bacterium]|jgi:Ohr subfamily peroxiredoxin|nr:Ohr family peroxiredoxin [Chitinophagaceae bacterium]
METTIETETQPGKVLYTGKTHTTGGRQRGISRSSDGHLDVKITPPNTDGFGTNPEQLFAAAWSACFEGALETAARRKHVAFPEDTAIDAEVDLCLVKGEYNLQARLNISLPGLDKEVARELVNTAKNICPYSKAVQGNVKTEYNVM